MQFSFIHAPEVETLVDDETGRIVYRAAFFDEAQIQAWFEQLGDTVEWRHERRPMYDRVVDVPRMVGRTARRPRVTPADTRHAFASRAVLRRCFQLGGLELLPQWQ